MGGAAIESGPRVIVASTTRALSQPALSRAGRSNNTRPSTSAVHLHQLNNPGLLLSLFIMFGLLILPAQASQKYMQVDELMLELLVYQGFMFITFGIQFW